MIARDTSDLEFLSLPYGRTVCVMVRLLWSSSTSGTFSRLWRGEPAQTSPFLIRTPSRNPVSGRAPRFQTLRREQRGSNLASIKRVSAARALTRRHRIRSSPPSLSSSLLRITTNRRTLPSCIHYQPSTANGAFLSTASSSAHPRSLNQ